MLVKPGTLIGTVPPRKAGVQAFAPSLKLNDKRNSQYSAAI